jgi:sodium transport system permease protein
MYFFPVYLTSLVPALAAVLPALSLRSAIVLVPLANVSVAVREIMMNRPDRPMIAVTFAVMMLTASLLMRASARMLSREEVIVPSQGEPEAFLGGSVLFQKRVLKWFAVMWAIVFAVAANIPQLATFRRQLLFNEFAIFGGATVLMLWSYRLNLREALALRPVRWPVWIAIVLAAPAGNLMSVAVFKLLNYVIPVPEQAAEQMAALMPKNISWWQLYLFIAVIPGVIEELAFRGILLHGLRRKLKPWFLPLAVGIIFGLFHFSLFRIGPTAFLGVLLTVIAMLTGSVFPGMLLHMLNNAFAVWTSENGWSVTSLDPGHYLAATVIFALAMWIIYRNRNPYPLK